MAAVTTDVPESIEAAAPRGDALRRYPPLLLVALAALLALVVLPSSLNTPQSNPTTTLELAPVPPSDDKTPPPADGNVSSLSLAGSGSIEQGGAPGGEGEGGGEGDEAPPVGDEPAGEARTNKTKKCVRGPDGQTRQSNDPLAPPCVATFDGDNFGATYLGVTGEEARVLVYVDGGYNDLRSARGAEPAPENLLVDLGQPPAPDEHVLARGLRVWQGYFNDRYQTYNRFVHMFVYFADGTGTPETRRADAADAFNQVKPFATVAFIGFDAAPDAYLEAMAKRGTIVFGDFPFKPQSFFDRYRTAKKAPLVWGYLPSLELAADQYTGYICKTLAGKNVMAGKEGAGGPRKYGLVYTADPGYQNMRDFKDGVKVRLERCGIKPAVEVTTPAAGYSVDNSQTPVYARDNMIKMQEAGVTTILWPGGLETKQSQAASQIDYYPEWITMGDGSMDTYAAASFQDSQNWDGAIVITNQVYEEEQRKTICYQAFREVDQQSPDEDADVSCDFYNSLRQVFTGIQVAGPRLGPTSIDEGFHAIPPIESVDPRVPACYYQPGDTTCVKDAIAEYWDRNARMSTTSSVLGCWRMPKSGRGRYLASTWPNAEMTTDQNRSSDVCNRFGSSYRQNLAPPGGLI